jgi:uncharacterized membrane protein
MLQKEMKKREFLLILILLFIGVNAISIMIVKDLPKTDSFIGAIQAIILFWTGVVLLWYTWETWGLRKEAQRQVEETQRQIEIQQRPFVIVQSVDRDKIWLRSCC